MVLNMAMCGSNRPKLLLQYLFATQAENSPLCLPGQGAPHRPDAVAVTGSEDGTLRRMTIDLQQPLQPLLDSQQIGEHPAGSAVKALSFMPWGPGEYHLGLLPGLFHLMHGATQVIA